MRAWPIDVTKPEFDRFLYPYGTNIASANVKEHLVSLRLVEKLQDPAITKQSDLAQNAIDEAEEKGEMAWATHKLAVDEHTFLFEEDEKRLMLSRLEKSIGRVPPALGAEFEVLRQKFVKAEPIDLAPPVEEEEEIVGTLKGSDLVEAEPVEEPDDRLEALEETPAGEPEAEAVASE